MEKLTDKQTYKNPESELGKNLIAKITSEGLKEIKCQFRLLAANNKFRSADRYEEIYIGLRGDKNLLTVIKFLCLFGCKFTCKEITGIQESYNFYLITLNVPVL